MAISIEEIVLQVKQANKLEDVIEETQGFSLAGHGRHIHTVEHDSLDIDTYIQRYTWWSSGENGDVIEWVKHRNGIDFKAAVEILCRRAGLRTPEWKEMDPEIRMAARAREDAFSVGAGVFVRWMNRYATARDYAHARGWSDETIQNCMLGYTGPMGEQETLKSEMRDALLRENIDPRSPAAVAFLGFYGDVMRWARDYEIDKPDNRKTLEEWAGKGSVPGIVGWNRLVYTHVVGGRIAYLSLRQIEDDNLPKKYNLNSVLAGERQLYLNPAWASSENFCVIVEGQADAISLYQLGIPAVALNGVAADERIAYFLGAKRKESERRPVFYLGLDPDKAGTLATSKVAKLLGPMTRIVGWRGIAGQKTFDGRDGKIEIKDANDLVLAMNQVGMDLDAQKKEVGVRLNTSPTYVEVLAGWVSGLEGVEQDDARRQAMQVFAMMSEVERSDYGSKLAKIMGMRLSDFQRVLKSTAEMEKQKDVEGDEVVDTRGGEVDGWFLEYLYNTEKKETFLAWKDPNGKVDSGKTIVIGKQKYRAEDADDVLTKGGVTLATELGDLKKTKELAFMIESFLNHVYIFPNKLISKIISYWVLMTWLYDSFDALPYLRATGPSGAGKSEMIFRVGLLCYRPIPAGGADTVSTLFRNIDRWRGTLLFDEGDLKESGADNDTVKLLNFGAMRGHPIWRTEEFIGPDGRKQFRSVAYETYCPKAIDMRREFRDDAVGNRSLTFKLQEHSMRELVARNIPLHINQDMREEAMGLQNLLMRWRIEHWRPHIEPKVEFYELDVSPRLNQVTGSLMMMAEDEPELQAEIRGFLREYALEQTQVRNTTILARVLEGFWKILQWPNLLNNKEYVNQDATGTYFFAVSYLTKVTNDIINTMNHADDDTANDQKGDQQTFNRNELSPHKIGRILREETGMQSIRNRLGYFIKVDMERLNAMTLQYGINPQDFAPIDVKKDVPAAIEPPPARQLEIGNEE